MRQITLYVPENDSFGRNAPHVTESITSEVVKLAGGATVTSAVGYWYGSRYFREPVKLISALVTDGADVGPFRKLAAQVKRVLKQESVLLTVTERIRSEFI